jgi:hypothetical protein
MKTIGVAFLATLVAAASYAQTPAPDPADPFFDDTVLHDISLAINPRDWASLKANDLDNTPYTCDFRWRDQVVRGIEIRRTSQSLHAGPVQGADARKRSAG